MSKNVLSAEHITRKYRGIDTIRDVSIYIDDGETVALLGKSGVGKTTLFTILAGLDRPNEGRVLLHGEDITGIPGKVSYMMQKDLLLSHKKIVDNVALPLILKKEDKKKARETAMALLEEFGLAHTAAQYPCELSGGMRQRAAFLRTYLASEGGTKGIILLDEPFSALDGETKEELYGWYKEMARKKGLTTFMITHDPAEAEIMADRIYRMEGVPGMIR